MSKLSLFLFSFLTVALLNACASEPSTIENSPPQAELRFVEDIGFLDGTTCETWPKALDFGHTNDDLAASLYGDLANIGAAAGWLLADGDSHTHLLELAMQLQRTGVRDAAVFGSQRDLVLLPSSAGQAMGFSSALVIDPSTRKGHAISSRYLCEADDLTAGLCSDVEATVEGETYQVLRRTDADETSSGKAVVLAARNLHVPYDVTVDVHLIAVAEHIVGGALQGSAVTVEARMFHPVHEEAATALADWRLAATTKPPSSFIGFAAPVIEDVEWLRTVDGGAFHTVQLSSIIDAAAIIGSGTLLVPEVDFIAGPTPTLPAPSVAAEAGEGPVLDDAGSYSYATTAYEWYRRIKCASDGTLPMTCKMSPRAVRVVLAELPAFDYLADEGAASATCKTGCGWVGNTHATKVDTDLAAKPSWAGAPGSVPSKASLAAVTYRVLEKLAAERAQTYWAAVGDKPGVTRVEGAIQGADCFAGLDGAAHCLPIDHVEICTSASQTVCPRIPLAVYVEWSAGMSFKLRVPLAPGHPAYEQALAQLKTVVLDSWAADYDGQTLTSGAGYTKRKFGTDVARAAAMALSRGELYEQLYRRAEGISLRSGKIASEWTELAKVTASAGKVFAAVGSTSDAAEGAQALNMLGRPESMTTKARRRAEYLETPESERSVSINAIDADYGAIATGFYPARDEVRAGAPQGHFSINNTQSRWSAAGALLEDTNDRLDAWNQGAALAAATASMQDLLLQTAVTAQTTAVAATTNRMSKEAARQHLLITADEAKAHIQKFQTEIGAVWECTFWPQSDEDTECTPDYLISKTKALESQCVQSGFLGMLMDIIGSVVPYLGAAVTMVEGVADVLEFLDEDEFGGWVDNLNTFKKSLEWTTDAKSAAEKVSEGAGFINKLHEYDPNCEGNEVVLAELMDMKQTVLNTFAHLEGMATSLKIIDGVSQSVDGDIVFLATYSDQFMTLASESAQTVVDLELFKGSLNGQRDAPADKAEITAMCQLARSVVRATLKDLHTASAAVQTSVGAAKTTPFIEIPRRSTFGGLKAEASTTRYGFSWSIFDEDKLKDTIFSLPADGLETQSGALAQLIDRSNAFYKGMVCGDFATSGIDMPKTRFLVRKALRGGSLETFLRTGVVDVDVALEDIVEAGMRSASSGQLTFNEVMVGDPGGGGEDVPVALTSPIVIGTGYQVLAQECPDDVLTAGGCAEPALWSGGDFALVNGHTAAVASLTDCASEDPDRVELIRPIVADGEDRKITTCLRDVQTNPQVQPTKRVVGAGSKNDNDIQNELASALCVQPEFLQADLQPAMALPAMGVWTAVYEDATLPGKIADGLFGAAGPTTTVASPPCGEDVAAGACGASLGLARIDLLFLIGAEPVPAGTGSRYIVTDPPPPPPPECEDPTMTFEGDYDPCASYAYSSGSSSDAESATSGGADSRSASNSGDDGSSRSPSGAESEAGGR